MAEQRQWDRTTNEIRKECYDELRKCVTKELHAYYEDHPEWLLDERSRLKLDMMMRVLSCQMAVLDGYDLCKR